MNTALIERLASKAGKYTVRLVTKRLIILSLLSLVAGAMSVLLLVLASSGYFTAEPTQKLITLCIITGVIIFLFGVLAICLLLWSAFVSAHLAYIVKLNDELEEDECLDIGIREVLSELDELQADPVVAPRKTAILALRKKVLDLQMRDGMGTAA